MVHPERTMTIALHKPAGFVSTRSDPHARDTIFDLLPPKFPRLFNIGRLDAQSEGLLLLTNDVISTQRLTHPRFKIEKEYEVTLDRQSAGRARAETFARNFFWTASARKLARVNRSDRRDCGWCFDKNQSTNPANALRRGLTK